MKYSCLNGLTVFWDTLYLTGILYVQCLQIKFAQWYDVMYKQTNTICKPKRIRLFTLIINCTILMKPISRNVYTISDRIWCNKHLRHTTTEKYENNGKGGYFRFDDDNTTFTPIWHCIANSHMGPFYYSGLTWISAWISIYIKYIMWVWDGILIQKQQGRSS